MPQPERCPTCQQPLGYAFGMTAEEAAEIPAAIYVPPGTVDYDPDAAAGK